ncbi:MAG: DUF4440 domain-containing protein [Terriglobales bacterium]
MVQEELVRRTQAIFDSVAGGDQGPWKKYFADDCMYFDERGSNMNKEALVASITPLPQGYWGRIELSNPQSRIEGHVAILSYDLDEIESVFGQNMKARYHATDTWLRRKGEWQIVAAQIFRYYEDPAPGEADPRTLNDYVGTYELAPGRTMTVSRAGTQLLRQRGDGPKSELLPEAGPIFFRKGVEGRTLFRRGQNGKVDALIERRNNEDILWKKVS